MSKTPSKPLKKANTSSNGTMSAPAKVKLASSKSASSSTPRKQQQHPQLPAVTTEEENEDEDDEPQLFHAATRKSVAANQQNQQQQQEEKKQLETSMDGDDADDNDNDDDPSSTSSSLLRTLTSTQSPILLTTLRDIHSKIRDLIRSTLRPLVQEMKRGEKETVEGMSYLELKSHLLLQYNTHLVFFQLCKLKSSDAHLPPVVKQLVRLRTIMEKCKSLDKKLKYQIEKILEFGKHAGKNVGAGEENVEPTATGKKRLPIVDDEGEHIDQEDADMTDAAMPSSGLVNEDPLSHRPNPHALVAGGSSASGLAAAAENDDEDESDRLSKKYQISRTMSVTPLDTVDRRAARKRKQLESTHKHLLSSGAYEGLSERPEEESYSEGIPSERRDEITRFEETNLMRMQETSKDRAEIRRQERVKNSLADLNADLTNNLDRTMQSLYEREEQQFDPYRDAELREQAQGRRRHGGNAAEGDVMGEFDEADSRAAKRRKLKQQGKKTNPWASSGKAKGGRGGKRR